MNTVNLEKSFLLANVSLFIFEDITQYRFHEKVFVCKKVSKITKSVLCDVIFIFIEISETPNSFVKIRLERRTKVDKNA